MPSLLSTLLIALLTLLASAPAWSAEADQADRTEEQGDEADTADGAEAEGTAGEVSTGSEPEEAEQDALTSSAVADESPAAPTGAEEVPAAAEQAVPAQTSEAQPLSPGRIAPFDALGRPFPDPELLAMGRRWSVGGAALTVGGASMVIAGLMLGSAIARGELVVPETSAFAFSGLLLGGPWLTFAGLPMLSAGNFVRGQLNRTIKGVPKVPRTVANERDYWKAHYLGLQGQATTIAGGGSVMLGVLGLVAAAFAMESPMYTPLIWLFPANAFGFGAGMIAGGLAMQRSSKVKKERIRDAVDPLRQEAQRGAQAPAVGSGPQAYPPLPALAVARSSTGELVASASVSWTLRF